MTIDPQHPKLQQVQREAQENGWDEKRRETELVRAIHQIAMEDYRKDPLPPYEPPTIHYRELPDGDADNPIKTEWDFYRREAPRLLAEGHEGKFVLIKGERIIGMWDTHQEADKVRREKFLMQNCLVQQILVREPVIRMSSRL